MNCICSDLENWRVMRLTPHASSSLVSLGDARQTTQRFGCGFWMSFTTENFTYTVSICSQMLNDVSEGFALRSKNMGGNCLLEIKTFPLHEYWVQRNTRDRVCVIRANAPVKKSHEVHPFWLLAVCSESRRSLHSAMVRTSFEGAVASFRAAGANCRPGQHLYQRNDSDKHLLTRLSIVMDKFFARVGKLSFGNLLKNRSKFEDESQRHQKKFFCGIGAGLALVARECQLLPIDPQFVHGVCTVSCGQPDDVIRSIFRIDRALQGGCGSLSRAGMRHE